MTGEEFKKEIQINPKKVYCLVSTDSRIIDLYIDRFKKAINANNIVYGAIKSYGKLFKQKTLSVLYLNKPTEDIFESHSYVFIHVDSIDKRSSVYKKYKDRFIEVSNNYVNLVISHSNMNKEQALDFINKCNNDLGIIENTLTLYNLSNMEYNDFIDYSNNIYNWVDCFIKREPLPNCIESPISIMSLLASNCNNLINVKTGNTAGMNYYLIDNLKRLEKYRTVEELGKIMSDCFMLDTKIKQGKFDIQYAIDYIINSNY